MAPCSTPGSLSLRGFGPLAGASPDAVDSGQPAAALAVALRPVPPLHGLPSVMSTALLVSMQQAPSRTQRNLASRAAVSVLPLDKRSRARAGGEGNVLRH